MTENAVGSGQMISRSNQVMSILQVTPGIPPDRVGGIENYVMTLTGYLRGKAHEVTILTRRWKTDVHQEKTIQLRVPPGEISGYVAWSVNAWASAHKKRRLVHCHGLEGACVVSLPNISRSGTVFHLHNTISRSPAWLNRHPVRHRISIEILKGACRIADRIIAPTESTREDLLTETNHLDPNKVRVIPNMVDTKKFAPRRDELALRDALGCGGRVTLMYFGKIRPSKGIETICRAYDLVDKKRIALVVAGSVSADDVRFLQILKSKFRDVVFALCADPVGDPPNYYNAADVFAIHSPPTRWGETFSIATLEAMSSGLPVICTDSPTFKEVTMNNALSVEFGNVRRLAEAFELLSGNDAMRKSMGAKSRKIAADNYSVEKVAWKVENLYRELA